MTTALTARVRVQATMLVIGNHGEHGFTACVATHLARPCSVLNLTDASLIISIAFDEHSYCPFKSIKVLKSRKRSGIQCSAWIGNSSWVARQNIISLVSVDIVLALTEMHLANVCCYFPCQVL